MKRMRLIHAAAELAWEQGPESVSVESVAQLAGVELDAFAREFEDIRACLQAGAETAIARGGECVRREASEHPAERPRAALAGLLDFTEQETELAGLCVVLLARGPGCGDAASPSALSSMAPALDCVKRALTVIDKLPDLHPQRLAARAAITSEEQSARLLERLQALGLVATNARGRVLTPAGHAFLRLRLEA